MQHNFQKSGNFETVLTVKTASGSKATVKKRIRVGFRLAVEHEPRFPLVQYDVRLVAKAFINLHADDRIVEYAWDLNGNGEFDYLSTDAEICHQYGEVGTYNVVVRATSDNGVVEVAQHVIAVTKMTAGFRAVVRSYVIRISVFQRRVATK